jgi:hypothetical protein
MVSFIIWRTASPSPMATAAGMTLETARTADSPGLMIALNSSTLNIPRFEMVNVLPAIWFGVETSLV